ncbi:trypsin-like serine protease [Ideonella sp. 4Y16]|uniref:trypsin-like serine peptidase n=1 Tax=Ideonella alba TaxID=2824118 RepID=UPI001B39616A|nr:trypsin-like peptidase domain-containing protein [Ideonella alba]MBQ0943672.1 trypsin-like serine protease [Ideonella alba]
MTTHASRRLALCLAGFVSATTASAADVSDAHRSISSDGTPALASSSTAAPAAGFRGRLAPGLAPDAEAEFPAERYSAAEMADFAARYRPMVAPGARGDDQLAPESVLGADRRFRVYPSESGYPYRAVGLLTFNQGTGSYTCTGWLISADTVATAGHCVHSGGTGGVWSNTMRFYPGRNAASAPYGSCTAKRLSSVAGWTKNADENYDYGSVKLNCTVGNTTGWLGRWWTTGSQANLPIAIVGYPGDKPSATQWGGAGRIAASESRKTRYFLDTAGGQSGAPVIQADGTGPGGCEGDCGIAIHAYGADSLGRNSATRITEAVNTNLQNWINTP